MSTEAIISLIGLVASGILIIFTYFFRSIQKSVDELSESVDERLLAIEAKYTSVDKNDAVLMKVLDFVQRELDEMKKNCRRCQGIKP